MTIVRITHDKERPYVVLNKRLLEDSNLSWSAKGLLSYLISRKDDWQVHVKHLASIYQKRGGGEEAIYNMLDELIEAGYCRRSHIREKGKFKQLSYTIYENKQDLKNLPPQEPINGDYLDESCEEMLNPVGECEEITPQPGIPETATNPDSPQGGVTVSGSTGSGKPGHIVSNEYKQVKKQQQLAAAASFEKDERLNKIDLLPISAMEKNELAEKYSLEQIEHILTFYQRKKIISPNYNPANWAGILHSCLNWPLPKLPEIKAHQKSYYDATDDEFIENRLSAEEIHKNYWRILDRQNESLFVSSEGYLEYTNSKKDIKKIIYFKSFTFKAEANKLIDLIKEEMKKRK